MKKSVVALMVVASSCGVGEASAVADVTSSSTVEVSSQEWVRFTAEVEATPEAQLLAIELGALRAEAREKGQRSVAPDTERIARMQKLAAKLQADHPLLERAVRDEVVIRSAAGVQRAALEDCSVLKTLILVGACFLGTEVPPALILCLMAVACECNGC